MKIILRKVINIVKKNNLFLKIFVVMLLSIFLVALLITFSNIQMSKNLFTETFTINNTKILEQIKTRFDSLNYSIITVTDRVQNNGTIKRMLIHEDIVREDTDRLHYEIIEQMKPIYSIMDPYDANMIISGEDERLFNMNYSKWPISWEILRESKITKNTVENPNELLYHFISSPKINREPLVVASTALIEKKTDNIYGILYISISEKELAQFYNNYTNKGNDILIINEEGQVISSNKEELIGIKAIDVLKSSQEIEQQKLDYQDINLSGKDYMLMSELVPASNMYLVNLVDKSIVMENLINTKQIVLISAGIAFIAIIVTFIIFRKMTMSLRRLVQQISNIPKHHFNKPISETGSYEARKIGNAFNSMLKELQEYVEIIIETQKKQRNSELEALQHQINPHFLYNTLTSVKIIVQQGKIEKAMETIHALGSLIQSALGNVDQTITVEQELLNTKNYVLINQLRYGDHIKVSYFISPNCKHYHLPKLIIQPFIENAFFHAFNTKKHGFIHILIAERGKKLVCEVIDNGDGMPIEKLNEFPKDFKGKRHLFSGIGVINVHERIQLLYGEEYGVNLSSDVGKGTKIKIELPLLE